MKNNIQAFPEIITKIGYTSNAIPIHFINSEGGMTLLDYFAGQALIGYASNQKALEEITELSKKGKGKIVDIIARHSYRFAEAMLKERERLNDTN